MEYSGEFVSDLIISHHAVFKIAEWFHCEWNMSIGFKSKKIRPSYEERHRYTDSGDFLFKREGQDKWEIAEVKHKMMDWTTPETFPYETIFVSNVHSVERGHEPSVWVMVNKSMTHAILIPKSTKKFWIKENVYNRNSKKEEEKYLCAKHLTKFCKIRTYNVDD